ncbi:hypothetical protein QTP88_015290 [Uroleucon formosanum]
MDIRDIPNGNVDESNNPDKDVRSNNGNIKFEVAVKDSRPHQNLFVPFPNKLFGKQNRSFSSKYYKDLAKYKYYQNTKNTGNIHVQMSIVYKEKVEKKRKYMLMIIDANIFLAHQGLIFRGNNKNKESLSQGKFKETCCMLATYDPSFATKDIAANQIFNAPKPKNPKNKRPMPEEGYH